MFKGKDIVQTLMKVNGKKKKANKIPANPN